MSEELNLVDYLYSQIKSFVDKQNKKPLIIGIQGVQGIGKSTVVKNLSQKFSAQQVNCASFSLDDFYITFEEQQLLKQYNRLWESRGLPGTHDIQLCQQVLIDLVFGNKTHIPMYDKAAHGGKGDRAGFCCISDKIDIILFEGWMINYRPLHSQEIESCYQSEIQLQKYSLQDINQINEALKEYQPLFDMIDLCIILKPVDLKYVYDWRLQQEHELSFVCDGLKVMSDEEVKQFIERFNVYYILYYGKQNNAINTLTVTLDKDRKIIP